MMKKALALAGALGAVAATATPVAAQDLQRTVVDYNETDLAKARAGLDASRLVLIDEAKDAYIRQSAREGRLLDAREVAVAPVGDHFIVYPASDKVNLRVVSEGPAGDPSRVSFEVSTEARGDRQHSATGLGFAPGQDQVGHGCYWLNGTSAASNRAHWCWTKVKVINDGDNTKDYYSYKRRISAFPSNTTTAGVGWYVRGITLRSQPTPGTGDRITGWTDWEPASHVSNGNSNMNLGISVGPINVGFNADVSGGTNPTLGPANGRFETTWSTGFFGYPKETKATAWHIGVTTGQGQIPYWGDYQLVTYCRGTALSCQNHASS